MKQKKETKEGNENNKAKEIRKKQDVFFVHLFEPIKRKRRKK